MEYVFLGKSDLQISRIGFGGMSLDSDDSRSIDILQNALGGGINFFDTADLYQQGRNEKLFGTAFKGKRNQIVLSSKVGNQWKPDGSGWDWNPRPEYIVKALEQSLERLQTDYLDLYQLHGGTLDDPIDDIIETFERLKTSGRIRHYGISSIRPAVIREWVKKSSMASVMMQYSLLDRRPEEEVFPLLLANQIGVLARGTVARGLLVSKPPAPFLNYSAAEVNLAAEMIKKASGKNSDPYDVALHFALAEPAVSAAIVGIRTENQLREALRSGALSKLDDQVVKTLKNGFPKNIYTEHR